LKIGLTILFSLGVVTVGFSQTNDGEHLTPQAITQKSQEAYAALTSYSDTGTSIKVKGGRTNVTTFSLRMQRTNSFILQWVQTCADQTNQGRWWLDGHEPFGIGLLTNIVGQATNDRPTYGMNEFEVREQTGEATRILELFFASGPFKLSLLGFMGSWTNSGPDRRIVTDGKVGDVDCYVLTLTTPELKHPPFPFPQAKCVTRMWIGKQDFLVHRFDYASESPNEEALTQIHEKIAVNRKYPDEDFQVKIPEEEHSSSITLSSLPPATNSDTGQTNDIGQKHKAHKRQKN
jgi:outer membrane lipoprotein-sorting protein